jgi:hypothetical protein
MDAVVISIPQMDSISVALMDLKYYKNKVQSSKLRFDILMLEVESLTYQLDYQKEVSKDLKSIIYQKDRQIKTLNDMLKPTFADYAKYGLIALIGFAVGVIISI